MVLPAWTEQDRKTALNKINPFFIGDIFLK